MSNAVSAPMDSKSHLTTFDLEPNPFEQSFAGKDEPSTSDRGVIQTVETPGGRRHVLPPVSEIASPAPLSVVGWANESSLRTGPLSPAMLQKPSNGQPLAPQYANRRGGNLAYGTGLSPGGIFSNPGPATAAILGLSDPAAFTLPNTPGSGFNAFSVTANASNNNSSQPASTASSQGQPMPTQAQMPQPRPGSQIGHQVPSNSTTQGSSKPLAQGPDDNATKPSGASRGSGGEADSGNAAAERKGSGSNGSSGIVAANQSGTKRSGSASDADEDEAPDAKKHNSDATQSDKRKSFLERNRIAALKCRQRKKLWVQNLEGKVEALTDDNRALQEQLKMLSDKLGSFAQVIVAHKDCPGIPAAVVAAAQEDMDNMGMATSNGGAVPGVSVVGGVAVVNGQPQQAVGAAPEPVSQPVGVMAPRGAVMPMTVRGPTLESFGRGNWIPQ